MRPEGPVGAEAVRRNPDSKLVLRAIAAAIDRAMPRCGAVTVVAIDGGAASGKSTLAAIIVAELDDAAIVHTNDLLDGWSDQLKYWPRLREQILRPLATGRPGYYRRYDWEVGEFAEDVAVPVRKTLIVEGVSAIAATGDRLSVGIMIDVPRAERERRWIERDGPMQPEWKTWLDNEDRHFAVPPDAPTLIVLP
ncbi:MAG TPA: uridine kinase [Jatrophihabitans sp.]|jgi:hypothetical protein